MNAVGFSPDSKLLALASGDGEVKLWDTSTGVALQTLEGHSESVSSVAFSPDGKVLASASGDGTVKLWNTSTGEVLQRLVVDAVIRTVSFTDDGTLLRTDRGTLCVTLFPSREAPNRPNISDGIFVGDQWITLGGRNVIWIPPEYRRIRFAVHGNCIVFGHRSDRLSILELAL